MSDPITLASGAFALKNTFGWIQSVSKAFIPFEDQVGQRSDVDKFQESTYGRPIPLIYGPKNRLAGNVIYYSGIQEKRNQVKHSNGTFGSSTYTIWYTYYIPRIAIAIGKNIRNVKRIWANGKLIFTNTFITDIPDAGWSQVVGGRVFSGIYLYNGSSTQVRSAAITDTSKPGYQNISYVVLTNFWVTDFGNGMPQFEFEVDGGNDTVYSIIEDICQISNLTSDEYSIDFNLSSQYVDGFIVSQQIPGDKILSNLSEIYPFDIVETPDRIYFKEKAKTVSAALDLEELNARENKEDSNPPMQVTRRNDFNFPKSASVTYIDYDRDYEENTQYSSRTGGVANKKINKKYEFTLSTQLAKKICERVLWEPLIERLETTIRTNLMYDKLLPGDYVGLKVGNNWVPFRIETKKRGVNGIIEFNVVSGDPSAYDGSTNGSDATPMPNDQIDTSDLDIYIFNAPYIESGGQPESANWVSNADTGIWRAGSLLRSTDGGSSFTEVGIALSQNVTGTVQNAIGSASAEYWDRANSITVVLDYDNHELNSLTELSVLNGLNKIWVGKTDGSTGEIISFATANLINSSPKTYVLTNLLRGQRATEHAISGHVIGEKFVLITDQIIQSFNYGYSDIGNNWIYKSVPAYFDEADVLTTFNFTNTGERAKPRSPVNCRGERDSSNNLTGYFERRTRLFPPGIGYGPVVLDEEAEEYQIDIYNVSFTTVLRTISVTSKSFSYTTAQQTADGLTPGNNVNCKIYQISPNVGRGHAGVFTI